MFALLPGGLEEGEALEEEDGEDTGHQVEDDAAEEGEADGGERGDATRSGGGYRGVRGRRGGDLAGDDRGGGVVSDLGRRLGNPLKSWWEGFSGFRGADAGG